MQAIFPPLMYLVTWKPEIEQPTGRKTPSNGDIGKFFYTFVPYVA